MINFTHEQNNGVLTLHLSGDLIGESGGTAIVEVANKALAEGLLTCVVDIAALRYINSSGIGVLITLLTKFRNKGGELYLLKPSDSVQKLLVITKLNAIFNIIQSAAEIK
jgi:anti-sigma B factor antagonist